jgi:S-adenosylmethionine:tRNA ribosyltransferase-isomerase
MKTSDFYYELPPELIAQHPLSRRGGSRMLKIDRASGEVIHTHFDSLPDFLKSGDCLVFNDSRVIPARLIGSREASSGVAELLLLKNLGEDKFEALARPGRRLKAGARLTFGGGRLTAEILEKREDGVAVVRFFYKGIWNQLLDELGQVPLPPYITEKLSDKSRYQTVYAARDGSAAAPTAGLHFTDEMLSRLREMGVKTVFLTLHVGLGTFRPVKEDQIEQHKMHTEAYILTAEAAREINAARANGGRVIAVGTTSCRVLETVADEKGILRPSSGETGIYIYPGYRFKIIDGLITNFHMPESTLLMLVSAFAGRENVLRAYNEAVRERYRFFSFGDCMIIL